MLSTSMRLKAASPKILLALGFLSLFLLISYQGTIREKINFNLKKAGIYKYNFFVASIPEAIKRERPVSNAVQEAELEVNIGEPFVNFTREDWDKFWEIIYGFYPREKTAEADLPNKMRQLSPDEIATELVARYPRPFARFNQSLWNWFFNVILEK